MAKVVKTNQLPVISNLNGAKLIGLDANGVDAQFNLTDITGDYKGEATPQTNPGTPVLNQYYSFTQIGQYPNFKDTNNAAINIPAPSAGSAVMNGRLVYTGNGWAATYNVVNLPVQDLTPINNSISGLNNAVTQVQSKAAATETAVNGFYTKSNGRGIAFVDANNRVFFQSTPEGYFLPGRYALDSIPNEALKKIIASNLISPATINKTLMDGTVIMPDITRDDTDYQYIWADKAGRYSLAIRKDGTVEIYKAFFKSGIILRDYLSAEVKSLIPSNIPSSTGYEYAFTDKNGKIAGGITTTGEWDIPKVLGGSPIITKRWFKKQWLAIGDSVTDMNLYPPVVSQYTGLVCTKHSKPGMNFVQMIDGDGAQTNPLLPLTVAEVTGKDLITVFGGFNNRYYLVGNKTDMYGTTGGNTIYGFINYVVTKLYNLLSQANNMTCRIAFILPYRCGPFNELPEGSTEFPAGSGQNLESIINAIKERANFYGLPGIDLYHNSGINNFNWNLTTADQLHVNAIGAGLIGRYIASEINKL